MDQAGRIKPSKTFGDLVAKFRTRQNWSRPKLVSKLHDILLNTNLLKEQVSESWLKDIENGERVKLTRPIILALAKALQLKQADQLELFIAADRNPLGDANGNLSLEERIATSFIYDIFHNPTAQQILKKAVEDPRAASFTGKDWQSIMNSISQVIFTTNSTYSSVTTDTLRKASLFENDEQ